MKVLSGTLCAIAALVIGLPMLANAATPPPPKTRAAIACLLGVGRVGCEADFIGATFALGSRPLSSLDVWAHITNCTQEYLHRRDRCFAGPLETVKYLGINAHGDDVYEVQFMHDDMTYVVGAPAPDGKIKQFWIFEGAPGWVTRRSVVDVTAAADQAHTLYTRHDD